MTNIVSKERIEFNKELSGNVIEDMLANLIYVQKMSAQEALESIQNWNKSYYVLDVDKDFDLEAVEYKVNKIMLRLVNCTDKFELNVHKHRRFKDRIEPGCKYINYGVYNGNPLYIHIDLYNIMKHCYYLAEFHHKEVVNTKSETIGVRGNTYTNTTETVRFYDGIILYSKKGIHADAIIGEYDRSWSGTIISNYKEEHINDMVTFNNKGVKIGKLYIELP